MNDLINGGLRCFHCQQPFTPDQEVHTDLVRGTYVISHEKCLARKTRPVMRSTTINPIKEKIMDENNTQIPLPVDPTDETVAEPSRLQVFVSNHPRAAKVAAITGGALSTVGVVLFAKTVQTNRRHVGLAAAHAKEALNELSTSVSPQDPEA